MEFEPDRVVTLGESRRECLHVTGSQSFDARFETYSIGSESGESCLDFGEDGQCPIMNLLEAVLDPVIVLRVGMVVGNLGPPISPHLPVGGRRFHLLVERNERTAVEIGEDMICFCPFFIESGSEGAMAGFGERKPTQ